MTLTTLTDAINWIAETLQVSTDEAQWIYDNTACPDWDAPEFQDYDFLSDPNVGGYQG